MLLLVLTVVLVLSQFNLLVKYSEFRVCVRTQTFKINSSQINTNKRTNCDNNNITINTTTTTTTATTATTTTTNNKQQQQHSNSNSKCQQRERSHIIAAVRTRNESSGCIEAKPQHHRHRAPSLCPAKEENQREAARPLEDRVAYSSTYLPIRTFLDPDFNCSILFFTSKSKISQPRRRRHVKSPTTFTSPIRNG